LGKDSTSRLLSEATHCTVPTAAVFDFRDTNQAGFDGMAVFEEESPFLFCEIVAFSKRGRDAPFVRNEINESVFALSLSLFFF
jgi:hypothetical protein